MQNYQICFKFGTGVNSVKAHPPINFEFHWLTIKGRDTGLANAPHHLD